MADYLFDPPRVQSVPIKGEAARFPVHRIFCVGRNYAAHAAEMGLEVDREAPFYFTKSAAMMRQSGDRAPYPPGTRNLHHEIELAVALGAPAFRISKQDAMGAVYGYACGLDMTRRDLQLKERERKRPWDLGKDFEAGTVVGPIVRAAAVTEIGPQRIHLEVNGAVRQDARLSDMIWTVGEIVSDLSRFYHLRAGDLILTGTPAGVGPVSPGDRIIGGIDGLDPVALTIGPAEA